MKTIRLSVLVLAAGMAGLAVLPGCSGTARSGTEYTMTPDRNLRFRVAVDLPTAHEAAVDAVKSDLGFTIDEEKADAVEGVVKGKTARGERVEVETFKEGDHLTRVDVFVGPLGDEPVMRELMNAIEKRTK